MATPKGLFCPVTIAWAPLPSRPEPRPSRPWPSRHRWLSSTGAGGPRPALPLPVSVSVAVTSPLWAVAVRVAVTVPVRVGANRTVTVQDLRGARLCLQVLAVMVNAAGPASATVSLPVARPPVLASVKALDAACPAATWP